MKRPAFIRSSFSGSVAAASDELGGGAVMAAKHAAGPHHGQRTNVAPQE